MLKIDLLGQSLKLDTFISRQYLAVYPYFIDFHYNFTAEH